MMPPPSQPPVSVEETENGYIVHAGSAVATISKTGFGYTVDADSQVLKEEYNLSPEVARIRRSLWNVMRFSQVPADSTLLILRTRCTFFRLSLAVEMICGFLPENFPEEDEWAFLSSWKNERDAASPDNTNEKPESTLGDIVSKVEDEIDAEFQSFSWTVKPGISATKRLDKSAFEHGETGIPKAVCPFFGADKLPAGGKIPILLINNSRMFSGYILKDVHTSERVKMRWDNDFTCVLLEQQSHDSTELHLEFVITEVKDKYETSISRISGSTEIESAPIHQEVSNELEKEKEKTDTKHVPESTKTSQENSRDSNVVSRTQSKSYSPLVIELHREISQLKRYRFSHSTPFTIKNGVILVFEEGEKYQNYDRIVYVGTHTAGHLQQKIQSFLSGTKYDVILRRNIGTALLADSPYQKVWQSNFPYGGKNKNLADLYDPTKHQTIEEQVSRYISSKMSYAIIKVEGSNNKLDAQMALVATLKDEYSRLLKFDKWLGSSHPSPNIHQTGLWQDSKSPEFSFHKDILKRVFKNIRSSSDGKVNSSSAKLKKTETLPSKDLPDVRQKLSVNEVKKPSMSETLFWKRVEDSANRSYTSQIQEKTTNSLEEKYKQIFAESYPNGMTITNPLQLRKLSRAFQAVNPDFETLEKEEAFALVTQIVQEIGVFCGENVWMPESAISINEDLLNKIITYISTNLETFPIVDIDRLYSDFRIWLPSSISSAQILNEILKQKLTKGYYFFENCVSNLESGAWKFVIKRVLKEYLLSCGEAVHISQLEEEFPHASQNLLREILGDVKAGFVGGGRSQNYAHVGIFELTDDVIRDIKDLLLKNMDEHTSSITTDCIEQIIHASYPELFPTYLERTMLQEILKYYLSDVFEFRRGAVTLPGVKRRSATDLVIQHFRKKASFTLQDVYDYIAEHHYSVSIMGVLLPLLQEHQFLRIDMQNFVSAKTLLIKQETRAQISSKLEASLFNGYICSDRIENIFSYPFIGDKSMNPYLIESIVRVYGSSMTPPLRVIDYYGGAEKPRGIIIKKDGKIQTHDDVLADLLSKQHMRKPFDSIDEAISFLKSEKYVERVTSSISEKCKTILNIK